MKDAFSPGLSDAEIISKRVETNKDEIKKFVEGSHRLALELHKALNDRVGDGKEGERNKIVGGGRVERRGKKISTTCYIIVIIMIVLVVAGSGAAIYMLFY